MANNETLQTQIDQSVALARSVVESWLPSSADDRDEEEEQNDKSTLENYAAGRPDRLGLGAKFLSHNEAVKHQAPALSKHEQQLRNKIINQNKRAAVPAKRPRSESQDADEEEEEDDDEQESKTSQANLSQKKIGRQGDFLSMYLSERSTTKKKKKNRKRKNKASQPSSESLPEQA
ncbi:hypothetical protein BCR43DRAFT_461541 [Syncephalastrum racemosum]|uniref:Uncharacterized protein n=1 Tax=Syncephalastrum racemosum TaxID=13706 RepID=A0A1X2H6J6_SYNRA|nr:hypothetical protein BCR43DRAFT_461541 [Syncephalastrum racemosum]